MSRPCDSQCRIDECYLYISLRCVRRLENTSLSLQCIGDLCFQGAKFRVITCHEQCNMFMLYKDSGGYGSGVVFEHDDFSKPLT